MKKLVKYCKGEAEFVYFSDNSLWYKVFPEHGGDSLLVRVPVDELDGAKLGCYEQRASVLMKWIKRAIQEEHDGKHDTHHK